MEIHGHESFTCSVVSDSATPWTVACQAPLSMGFPRQEYWGGLSFPSPGDHPDPGIVPESPESQALPSEPPKPRDPPICRAKESWGGLGGRGRQQEGVRGQELKVTQPTSSTCCRLG